MQKIIDLHQHLSYTSMAQVGNICKPLCYLGVNIFRYLRRYPDGSRCLLTNHPCFVEYFYGAGKYQLEWSDSRDLGSIRNAVEIWETNILFNTPEQLEVTKHVSQEYKMNHGLILIKPYENFIEFFDFISDKNDLYQYDIKLFQRFIYYFKQEAHNLIQKITREKIWIPEISLETPNNINNDSVEKFIKETKINAYYIQPNETQVYLTRRELECMQQRLVGNTAKEIAHTLHISKKTVDRHFENLREKIQTIKQTRVIKTALELGLLDIT